MQQEHHGRVGIALVGGGRMGGVHYRNILGNRRFDLIYVVDVIAEKAKELAEKAGGLTQPTSDLAVALGDHRVKCVLIATPTNFHVQTILAAVKAKKHVMCEKPISLDLKEIDECYGEAAKNGVHLLCGYQRRHDASFAKLQKAIASGVIGQTQMIRTTARDHPAPNPAFLKTSGGMFHDCASHDIDVQRWIAGEDPVSLYATGHCFSKEIQAVGIGDWDCVTISLKYPSGILGLVDVSRNSTYGYDQRIEVLGSKGMLQAENPRQTTVILSNEHGATHDVTPYSFPERYVVTYASELDHFADVVEGKCALLVTHDDARKQAILAEAATRSARTGEVIQLKYD